MENNTTAAAPAPALQRLDPVGKLFSDAWQLFGEKGMQVFKIIVIPTILVSLPRIAMGLHPGASALAGFLALVGAILYIPAVPATLFTYNEGVSMGEAYRRGWKLFWPFLWLGILQGLVTIGGLMMAIIPGILMGVWFFFSHYTFVLEGKRGLAAMTESRSYVRGYWWASLGRAILVGLVVIAVVIVLTIPLSIIFGKDAGAGLGNLIASLVTTPFSIAYLFVLYRNFKALKPGVATEDPKQNGKTFFTVSAVVGIFGMIGIVLLIATGIWYVRSHAGLQMNDMNFSSDQWQQQMDYGTGSNPATN